MDIFEHESQYSVHLCESTDDLACICLVEVLKREFGPTRIDKWWAPVGWDINWFRFHINGIIITVQEEAFIGIDVFGPQALVDDIMQRVQLEMQGHQPD